jgi:hypothetical protein
VDGEPDRLALIRALHERSVFGGDHAGLAAAARELDALDAELMLARGKLLHARFLAGGDPDDWEPRMFEAALSLYQQLGDLRGEAEALCWIGIHRQVVLQDDAGAVPTLQAADELATRAGDRLTRSYALRHLGIAAHWTGDVTTARRNLEESTRLRRELDFPAGVAANLVGLIYLARAEGRDGEALAR